MSEETTTETTIEPMRVAGYVAVMTIAIVGGRRLARFIRDIKTDAGRVEDLSQVAPE